MPRYFFHVREIVTLVEDEEGTECADGAAAREEAIRAARDVMAEHVRKGLDVSCWSFEINDEQGRPVMTVPFSAALRTAAA